MFRLSWVFGQELSTFYHVLVAFELLSNQFSYLGTPITCVMHFDRVSLRRFSHVELASLDCPFSVSSIGNC